MRAYFIVTYSKNVIDRLAKTFLFDEGIKKTIFLNNTYLGKKFSHMIYTKIAKPILKINTAQR